MQPVDHRTAHSAPPPSAQRLHPGAVVTVLLGLMLVAGGVVLAVRGSSTDNGPARTVERYFAALARGDAPGALAYAAPAPAAQRQFLTSDVLAAQNRIGTPEQLHVGTAETAGDAASVPVTYRLFGSSVEERVPAVRVGRRWELRAPAVTVSFRVGPAAHRLLLAGTGVPSGPVLIFPGATPAQLDTPALQLAAADRVVRFAQPGPMSLTVELSASGRHAVTTAVGSAVEHCLAAPDPSCPLPNGDPRIVPGTLRGSSAQPPQPTVTLADDPDGRIDVGGTLQVRGTYQQLDFENQASTATGTVSVPLAARCWASSPTTIRWTSS